MTIEAERKALSVAKRSFEALGYSFVVDPNPADLPDILAGFRPDAIATRGDERVVIEVKRARGAQSRDLEKIRSSLEGRGWRFAVVYAEDLDDEKAPIPAEQTERIAAVAGEIRRMAVEGHRAAALVMAFALLETVQRVTQKEADERPKRPGTVVQALAMDGLVSEPEERRLRDLAKLRNAVVHGDLSLDVSPGDIELVLGAAERALANAPD